VEIKPALSKLKALRGTSLYFFFCEAAADGKPALLIDKKKIASKEFKPVLETAKKKAKCVGRLEMNEKGELLVTPIGGFPSTMAKGIQVAARNANAMVFSGIIINPAEPETADDDAIPEAPPLEQAGTAETSKAPPSVDAAKFTERLKQVLPRVLAAQKASPGSAEALKAAVSQAQVASRKQDFAEANALLDKVEELILAPSTTAPPSPNGSTPSSHGGAQGKKNPGLAVWAQERTRVVDNLKTCAKAVSQTKLPNSQKAAVRVLAIAQKLTSAPESEKQVGALERYIKQDELMQAVEKFPGGAFSIRGPLLAALVEVRKHLAS
jgi:hypothetical protein